MKKIISVLFVLVSLFALASCFSVNEVTSIEFSKAPAAVYKKNEKVPANQFKVKINYQSGSPLELVLNDSRLTVTGLDGDYLDTKSHGTKTVTVSYQGFSVSISYLVEGELFVPWTKHASEKKLHQLYTEGIQDAADLALLSKLSQESDIFTGEQIFTLKANIDLSAYQWVPIKNFAGTFDGGGFTITGLKITDPENNLLGKGLFGTTKSGETATIKNLIIDGAIINSVTDGMDGNYKNYAAVVGDSKATTTIEKVTVQNSIIVAHGRVGALVGQSNASLTIKQSSSINNTFTAINGYAVKHDDGEGDKVGGLVGQSQNNLTITDSLVEDVVINGTRDLGGLVGYVTKTTTIKKNSVINTMVTASIPGGMTPNKGTRNLGIFVGTVAKDTTIEFGAGDDVNINQASRTITHASYGEISLAGELFGAIRADGADARVATVIIGEKNYKITVKITEPLGSNERYEKILSMVTKFTEVTDFLKEVADGAANPSLPEFTEIDEIIVEEN